MKKKIQNNTALKKKIKQNLKKILNKKLVLKIIRQKIVLITNFCWNLIHQMIKIRQIKIMNLNKLMKQYYFLHIHKI